jgi:CheY-like chemotaxis protein/two-component sensor histidine kinase
MSKIEAGKFELDLAPLDIEKLLKNVCNLVIDKTESKNQKFEVLLDTCLNTHYIGDALRITQVITNLLSNAVKFTPEHGCITLDVKEIKKDGNYSTLLFSVADTGVGIRAENINKLFNTFEQVDVSISRNFGGTGLGLSIAKSLAEKMGGRLWAESEVNKGSVFHLEIKMEVIPMPDKIRFIDGIIHSDLKTLMVEGDGDIREHFGSVMESFGIQTDFADSSSSAMEFVNTALKNYKSYDVVFLDYYLQGKNSLETANALVKIIDKNSIVIMTSILEWHIIESQVNKLGINRFIAKPLFPSSILYTINDVLDSRINRHDSGPQKTEDALDFSGLNILLAEDIEINREIVIALLEDTHINIDVAENGLEAVGKFKENPEKYRLIFMDIQMPEMNGYDATRAIRQLTAPSAKTVPIIAMSANAFKEDVDKCIACGMNGHIAKPINPSEVIEKIMQLNC